MMPISFNPFRLRAFALVTCLIIVGRFSDLRAESSRQAASDAFRKTREIYLTDDAVKVKPAFLPLPAGAVSPRGWLRDWAVDAANGITGHLDEHAATFADAWKGYGFKARGAKEDGTGWPLEQCSYWLDGAVRLAYLLDDQELINKIKKRLDTVVSGVLNGGESFIYWRPNAVLSDDFNNWAHSHMGRTLVAYYQASGDPKVLEALVKVYRDYPLPEFRSHDVSGGVNIDAMLDTYLMSGDRRVLDRAVRYAQTAGYRDAASRWLQGPLQSTHNVVFYENIRLPALLYPWTGNNDDLNATLGAVRWHDEHHMLPIGLSSGEEMQAGIGATRNVETCDVPASMWTYRWLLRITGEGSYSDRIEKIFFNAGPAPVSRDFKTMCYYQSPNRYSSSLPKEEPLHPGAQAYQFTKTGHRVLCCVGNLNRVIPGYVMHMWMATPDRGLASTLHGPSSVRTVVGENVPVEVEAKTDYPFEETIAFTVRPEKQVDFPLYLRIPGWCRSPEISVNGNPVPLRPGKDSFVKLVRNWRMNDTLRLRLPMSVKVVKGRETPYPHNEYFSKSRKIGQQREINSPYASIYYGPLVFALPIPDENPNQEAPNSRYNYALDVKSEEPGSDEVAVIRRPLAGKWAWPLSAPLQLAVKAREFDWQPSELQPLPKEPVKGGNPAKVVLVPYGCTKFRVSMFPVTEAAWKSSN